MLLTVLFEVFAYPLPPGDVPGGPGCFISMDLQARHMPPFVPTPTSLPDPLHLALLGKDDGSLHPNSLKLYAEAPPRWINRGGGYDRI